MSTEPPVVVLHNPKDVDLYIEKLLRYEHECGIVRLWFLTFVDFSAALGVSSLSTHYKTMVETGNTIPFDSCIYKCDQGMRVRWEEWIKSNPLTFHVPAKCDNLTILFKNHHDMMREHTKKKLLAQKAKPAENSLSWHKTSPVLHQLVLHSKTNSLSRVSRSQYRLSGACVLLWIAAVFTDGVSDGYPTSGTLWHFFCLGALYVALHIALTLGIQQQEQLNTIGKGESVHTSLDPLMMYMPLCMAICPHLCGSVLYLGRGVTTKPPVDDMMLTVIGLGIFYTWYYHSVVIPQRWNMWVVVMALKSILWACEYIASGEISVSSSSLQYQLVQLGFPHGNTLYLLSGAVRYCIASRFMIHKGVHTWSRYTSIVVCLFLLTYPHFIHPDLTLPRTPVVHAYASDPLAQHASGEYCNVTAVDGVLSTFMGKSYATMDNVPCRFKHSEQCSCKDTAVCKSILFSQDNDMCIKILSPGGGRGTMGLC